MENNIQVFNFEESDIRTVVIENEAWFVGKDVAKTLGYARPQKAMQDHVDEDDKKDEIVQFSQTSQDGTTEKPQNLTLINESGVYSLIFGSKLSSAKKFKKWVTSEVLPAIRQTGSYQMPMSDFEKIALIAKGTKSLNDKVVKIESTVKTYIEERPLSATDYGAVGKAVNSKVHSYASIRKIPKSVRGPLFKDLNSQIKQLTGAGNRSRIMSRDYDRVIEFIDMWEPSTVTKSEVQELIEEMGE